MKCIAINFGGFTNTWLYVMPPKDEGVKAKLNQCLLEYLDQNPSSFNYKMEKELHPGSALKWEDFVSEVRASRFSDSFADAMEPALGAPYWRA